MDRAAFDASLAGERPPAGLKPPLQALWWAAKGDWSASHKVVQQHNDRDCAWVHAYLHRLEGDLANAKYWYGRAGRKVATGPHDAERDAMVAALL